MKRDFLRVCGDCGGLEGRRYGVGAGMLRLVGVSLCMRETWRQVAAAAGRVRLVVFLFGELLFFYACLTSGGDLL